MDTGGMERKKCGCDMNGMCYYHSALQHREDEKEFGRKTDSKKEASIGIPNQCDDVSLLRGKANALARDVSACLRVPGWRCEYCPIRDKDCSSMTAVFTSAKTWLKDYAGIDTTTTSSSEMPEPPAMPEQKPKKEYMLEVGYPCLVMVALDDQPIAIAIACMYIPNKYGDFYVLPYKRRDEKKELKAKDDGWIKWEAKPDSVRPLDGNVMVECVLYCGDAIKGLAADLIWQAISIASVTKYRIIKDA